MRKFSILILLATISAGAETDLSVVAGSYFESNVYYLNQGERSDGRFRVAPKLEHESYSNALGVVATAGGSYNKYLAFQNQDYFDFDTAAKIPILHQNAWKGYVGGDFKRVSDPAGYFSKVPLPETGVGVLPTRIDRNQWSGTMGTSYQFSPLSTIKLDGRYQTETYEETYHKYLDNWLFEGTAYYDYQFLPETTFFLGGMLGTQNYPKGSKNDTVTSLRATEYKYSSQYIEGRSGIRGRLAERTRVDASFAIQIRTYAKDSGFSEPVFNLRIEEQFSPKDLLIAGYDYDIKDSKWTNFVIDQSTYIGYARILGDQLLLLGKLAYIYSSFSKPYKREDQRLAGSFRLDFSVSPGTKLSGLFDIDVLNSDQIDGIGVYDRPDKSVSYQFFRSGLELTHYF